MHNLPHHTHHSVGTEQLLRPLYESRAVDVNHGERARNGPTAGAQDAEQQVRRLDAAVAVRRRDLQRALERAFGRGADFGPRRRAVGS